jgi:hypothetical protein
MNKKLIFIYLLIIITTFFSGCESIENIDPIYNSVNKRFAENQSYIFYLESSEILENQIMFCNKERESSEALIKNLFKNDFNFMDCLFVQGDNIYYGYFTQDYSKRGLYEEHDKFRLMVIDTKDFSEKLIYEANAKQVYKDFMGTEVTDNNAVFYKGITGFFLNNKYIYFITSNQIWEIERLSGKKNSIIKATVMRNVAYDGKNIYYINDLLQLIKYNTETKKSEAVSDIITEYFVLDTSKLYYINRRDNYNIYSYDFIKDTITKINNYPTSSFVCDNQYIFYLERQTSYPHRINIDGSNDTVVMEDNAYSLYLFHDYDKIHINLISDSYQKVIINKNTLQKKNQ